jgi:hypothetical protein
LTPGIAMAGWQGIDEMLPDASASKLLARF